MIALRYKHNEKKIKLLINEKTDFNQKNNYGTTPLMLALKSKYNENIIKLLINDKTEFNQKDSYGDTPLMYALIKKTNENIIKLLINEKTDFNQKDNLGDTPLKILLKNYSSKSFSSILLFSYLINKELINIIKLNINHSNFKFFLEIPVNKEKDIFGWDLSTYMFWNKRKGNINYYLIYSH